MFLQSAILEGNNFEIKTESKVKSANNFVPLLSQVEVSYRAILMVPLWGFRGVQGFLYL